MAGLNLLLSCASLVATHPIVEPAPAPRAAGICVGTLSGASLVWPPAQSDAQKHKAICLFFVGKDCPIANSYAPEIGRIAKQYETHGITFVLVYPLPDTTAEAVKKHAKAYQLPGAVVWDRDCSLALKLGATRTPEAVVVSPNGTVWYRGRIDNRYEKVGGKRREIADECDLRKALDSAVLGKPAMTPWPVAIGCDIDFPK